MRHCPYLQQDNRCEVASRIAECSVKASAGSCAACQQDINPQATNVVTIGMALVSRKRRGKPVEHLKRLLKDYLPESEAPATLSLAVYRPGPGSELKKMLAWFARPDDSCDCESHAETMNDWGAEGCRQNLETIIDWLMEQSERRGLPHGSFTRIVARSLVLTAIRRFEQKYPDGTSEPED